MGADWVAGGCVGVALLVLVFNGGCVGVALLVLVFNEGCLGGPLCIIFVISFPVGFAGDVGVGDVGVGVGEAGVGEVGVTDVWSCVVAGNLIIGKGFILPFIPNFEPTVIAGSTLCEFELIGCFGWFWSVGCGFSGGLSGNFSVCVSGVWFVSGIFGNSPKCIGIGRLSVWFSNPFLTGSGLAFGLEMSNVGWGADIDVFKVGDFNSLSSLPSLESRDNNLGELNGDPSILLSKINLFFIGPSLGILLLLTVGDNCGALPRFFPDKFVELPCFNKCCAVPVLFLNVVISASLPPAISAASLKWKS